MSKGEDSLIDYLHENCVKHVIHNDRRVIAPLEIDVVCPDYKLGFELNPQATHGTAGLRTVDDYYHMEKSLRAREHNFRLTHIFSWSMNETSPVWRTDAFTAYVAGLIIPEYCDVVRFDTKSVSDIQALWQQWDVFDRCQLSLALDDTVLVAIDTDGEPLGMLWRQEADQIMASYLNDNVSVWRYLGKPGIVMANFWDIWDKARDHTLLMESLDCQQIAIPLQGLYDIKTMSPDYYVMPVSGHHRRQSLAEYCKSMAPYDSDPLAIDNMTKHGYTKIATAGYQLWSSFLF